jgi:hypothetical protein
MKLYAALSAAFAASLSLVALAPAVQAQNRPLEVYVARLSSQDHYNSNGERLRTAAGIIRQDRANYHEFGKRDGEDTNDSFFASKANRARLEQLLLRGHTTRGVSNEIVNGEPLIVVEVYDNYVNVYVK